MIFILGGFRKGVVITISNEVSQLTNYTGVSVRTMVGRSNGHGMSFNATVRRVGVICEHSYCMPILASKRH